MLRLLHLALCCPREYSTSDSTENVPKGTVEKSSGSAAGVSGGPVHSPITDQSDDEFDEDTISVGRDMLELQRKMNFLRYVTPLCPPLPI